MKLALSMLCENPQRKTGLTTLFHELVSRALVLFPDVEWLLFAGPEQIWSVSDTRIELNRTFPANDRLNRRLIADHFRVPVVAARRGANALITVGFVPVRKTVPVVMQVFSLQHLDSRNRVGLAREMYRRWVTRVSWPKADLIITNSKFAVSQILSVYPEFAPRLVQSYEGLQHEQFNTAAPATEPAEIEGMFGVRPGYLLWISNFYPYKQADLLISAYARLPELVRRIHPLVMVGGDWENTIAEAKALAQKLGVQDTVRFFGWVEDKWLAPLYRQASAFCLASREETFGRCVIEAMACGTPVIANDIPIMREVTGGDAALVDFAQTEAVTSLLNNAVTDSAWRANLRACGLKRAAHFTFESLVTERINAIRSMLERRKL